MFKDCEVKPINFYSKVKKNKIKINEKETQTENNIEYENFETQTNEYKDSETQTNIGELLSKQNKNFDEKKLLIFLDKVENFDKNIFRRNC